MIPFQLPPFSFRTLMLSEIAVHRGQFQSQASRCLAGLRTVRSNRTGPCIAELDSRTHRHRLFVLSDSTRPDVRSRYECSQGGKLDGVKADDWHAALLESGEV